MTMRERFLDVVAEALDRDPRVAVVLAEIDVGACAPAAPPDVIRAA